jgi:hypothetical protein
VTRMRLLAAFVALHGLAHLAGAADLLVRAADGLPTDLIGTFTLDDLATLGALGLTVGMVAFAYLGAAWTIWTARPTWASMLRTVTLASLAVVVLTLPASAVGVAIDLALLALTARPQLADRGAGPRRARPGAPAARGG